jgi:hypothetical protein
MSISVTSASPDILVDNRGIMPDLVTLSISGMSAGASNSVPHGLPRTPKRVWFTAIGAGVNEANCSLDTSTAAAGFDGTNIYIFTPASVTSVLAHVEY